MNSITTKYFNAIPDGDSGVCLLIYKGISDFEGDISADEIVTEFLQLVAFYKNIDIRINSVGGDVFQGIAIFNAIRNSTANINIYIDGIAASIASVIALCGKHVEASKYARIMIHSVQGGCWGDKNKMQKAIDEISSLEDTLAEIYSQKTGKTPDEIKASYFDGTEHWFTAQEALALGFIDGIYDVEPVPGAPSTTELMNIFTNRITNQTTMFEVLRKRPLFANCASDDEVLKQIEHLETEAAKVPDLNTQNAEYKNKLDAYAQKEKEAHEAEIKRIVNTAKEEHRITEAQVPTYEALLTSDFTNGKAALDALPPKKNVNTPPPAQAAKGAWDARMDELRIKNKK